MLTRLEDIELICRRPNPDDGRAKLVGLTRKRKSLLRKIWKVHERQLEHVMSGLDENERLELSRLLNKMISAHK